MGKSKRDLKKIINSSFDYLYNDCILYSVAKKDSDLKKSEALLSEMFQKHKEILSRLSISEGREVKGRTKLYYKKIAEDFKTSVDTFGKSIQSLDK